MKAITKYWIILLCLLGLLYLWDSSLVAIAQEQVETRQPTQLTTQSPVVTTDDHARIAFQLQSVTGTPIANAIILLSGHQPQAEQIETDENGQAWWQLPDGFAHGEYVLKAVFGGSATLQPAIAVLKLTLQPTSTSAAVTRGPLVGEPLARKPLSTRLESKTVAQEAVQQAAIESRTVPRASVIAAKVAKNTTAVTRNVSQPTTANPVAQFANPMPSLTVISFRQQAAGLLAAMRSLATVLPRGPRVTLSLLALIGLVIPAGYVMRRRLGQRSEVMDLTGYRLTTGVAEVSLAAKLSKAFDWSLQLPLPLWNGLRLLSVGFAIGIAGILFARPAVGLELFWHLLIPLLPLLFFVAPGLWRNLCPMAALNQTPRRFHFTRAGTVPKWFQRYGYLIAISLFLTAVASRKVIFNDSGPALAILILCALSAAFITGIFFRGKSGWCSSICPLLPVQRIYGQTPFVTVAHAHCEPCLGCTKNCYDLSPRNAYLADLYDEEPYFALFRKAFVGFFPGFVLSFYLVPNPPAIAIWQVYALLLLGGSLSMGCYFLIEGVTKAMSKEVTSNQITVWFGALALNLYYWFNAPTLGALIAQPAPEWFVWPLRTLVLGLTLFWIYRTYRKESDFIEFTLAPVSIHGDQRTAVAAPVAPTGATQSNGTPPTPTGKPRLTIEPEGNCLEVDKNRTLLELCEQHGLPIEAGCRMGLCGADPVCVLEGMENLSKISDEERKTLERLGLAPTTRMACMARVRGDVKLALTPERPDIYRSSVISGFRYDKQVTRVVIVGNGIAGVTAADHIRRRHPHCEIHLIGRERHHLYNRMGITRLIYGRSAMQGLMLLPEQWYEDFNITCWLNTQVNDIDATAQVVTLGTGETLPYDRLILTTGSQSFVPPITGFGLDGSFVLRTADDAMAIRAYVQNNPCQHAVIAGGGLLGLEAAYGLHQLGLKVTVLERSGALLTRQLDQRGSDHLLAHLRGMGIDVQLQAEAAALESMAEERAPNEPARLRRLTLADGSTLPCDLVLVAAGIRPELTLAQAMALDIRRGVVVDAQMRSSDPHVFAAGDVAEFNGNLFGLWPVAVNQAEVAAANAVAEAGVIAAEYAEAPAVTMLKVVGVDLTSIGRIAVGAPDEMAIVHEDEAAHRYRKLIIAENKIVGAILLGYPELAPDVTTAAKAGIDISNQLTALQAGDWTGLADAT